VDHVDYIASIITEDPDVLNEILTPEQAQSLIAPIIAKHKAGKKVKDRDIAALRLQSGQDLWTVRQAMQQHGIPWPDKASGMMPSADEMQAQVKRGFDPRQSIDRRKRRTAHSGPERRRAPRRTSDKTGDSWIDDCIQMIQDPKKCKEVARRAREGGTPPPLSI